MLGDGGTSDGIDVTAVGTGERTHGVNPNLILAVTAVAGLAYAMLSSAVIPALPSIQHSLNTTETGVTWLLTGYLLSASVATSIIGRLGDMYGKEQLLLITLGILGVGTVVSALSTSLVPMIVGRVIQGAGGGIFPLAFGIVRDEFPKERVAGSIGILSSILGVGGGIGIVIGGLIVEHLDYHWLFWIPLIVTVIAAICTWRFIPESPVKVPGHVNWLAAALMTAGFSCVLIAISETTTWGWGSAKTLGLLAVGLVLCAAWIWVEVHSREPLIDMTMMRIRGVWTTNLVAFLLGAGMYASFLVFPQFAQLPTSTGFGFGASVVVAGPVPVAGRPVHEPAGQLRRPLRPSLRIQVRRHPRQRHHRPVVCLAGGRARPPLRHADQRGAAGHRYRTGLRRAGQPDRAGGAA